MFAVSYCMEAKRGPCQLCWRRKLLPSTSDASVIFSELGGNIRLLRCTGLTTMYTKVSQHMICWIGYVLMINNEHIPKSLIYSELVGGKRNVGRPRLRYKNVCKIDLNSLHIDIDDWEKLIDDCNKWLSLFTGEAT